MIVRRIKREQAGFSLVELMVGMLLGLMLIAGAVSIYLASKRSYVEVEQVAALSENARFAQQIIGDSLRHAGFFGEVPANRVDKDSNLTAVVDDCDSPADAYNLARLGYAATADSSGNALGCISGAVPNTDVLVIKHALTQAYSDGPRIGKDPNDPLQNDGVIDTPTTLDPQKVYVMTNNVGGLIFDGDDTPPTITTGGQIPGGTAWEYQYEVFYVKNDTVPQLARRTLVWNGTAMALGPPELLVEGVENLRLLFGFDSTPPTPGDPNDVARVDSYRDLAGIGSNWSEIQSVEIFILVRSATKDVQYFDEKTYLLGGGTRVGPFNDNYRRLLSYTSISLRNLKLMLMMRGGT
jgi:type IV pilus assembly protein PilW